MDVTAILLSLTALLIVVCVVLVVSARNINRRIDEIIHRTTDIQQGPNLNE